MTVRSEVSKVIRAALAKYPESLNPEERAREVVRAALRVTNPEATADAVRQFPEAVRLAKDELVELAGRPVSELASELTEVLALPLEYARFKPLHEYPRRVQDAVHTAAVVDDLGGDFREAIIKVLPVFERELRREQSEDPSGD